MLKTCLVCPAHSSCNAILGNLDCINRLATIKSQYAQKTNFPVDFAFPQKFKNHSVPWHLECHKCHITGAVEIDVDSVTVDPEARFIWFDAHCLHCDADVIFRMSADLFTISKEG